MLEGMEFHEGKRNQRIHNWGGEAVLKDTTTPPRGPPRAIVSATPLMREERLRKIDSFRFLNKISICMLDMWHNANMDCCIGHEDDITSVGVAGEKTPHP